MAVARANNNRCRGFSGAAQPLVQAAAGVWQGGYVIGNWGRLPGIGVRLAKVGRGHSRTQATSTLPGSESSQSSSVAAKRRRGGSLRQQVGDAASHASSTHTAPCYPPAMLGGRFPKALLTRHDDGCDQSAETSRACARAALSAQPSRQRGWGGGHAFQPFFGVHDGGDGGKGRGLGWEI